MAERTCIVTRKVCEPSELIRFVRGPDGSVVPDLKRNLPGRGVWVTARHDYVDQAAEKALFSRGLKAEAKAPPDLADTVEGLLAQDALGSLGIARKAGQCVTGSGKVDDAIRGGKSIGVLHAIDGAQDGLRKIKQATAAASQGGEGVPVWRVFTADEMSLALGAAHVIHAALLSGGAAAKCARAVERLIAYRRSGKTDEADMP